MQKHADMDQRIKSHVKKARAEIAKAVYIAGDYDLELQGELDEIQERLVGLLQEHDGGGDE